MPIFRGTNNISKIFRGNTEIVKAFRGTDLIFTSFQLPQYELIADVNVTANTTQIDFDNLNITKDDELRLVYTMIGNTTSPTTYQTIFNDVNSNYTRQQLFGDNTIISSSRNSTAQFVVARSNAKSNGFSDIKISNNNRFVFQSQFSYFIGAQSSSILNVNWNVANTSTVTIITKLSIVSSNSGGIASGSRLTLYKVNTGVA